jgi:hypothetical protein
MKTTKMPAKLTRVACNYCEWRGKRPAACKGSCPRCGSYCLIADPDYITDEAVA